MKCLPVNDGGVAFVDIVFGQLSNVLLLLVGEQVRHVGLLEQGVPNVFFVPQHTLDHAVVPGRFAPCRFDAVRHQILADPAGAVAHQIAGKDPAHHSGLLLINFRLAVRTFAVSKEAVKLIVHLSILEILAVAPLDAAAERLALRLGL